MNRLSVAVIALLLVACAAPPAPASTTPSASPASAESVAPTPIGLTGELAYVAGLEDPQIHLLDLATGESRQLTQLDPADAELTSSGPLRPALTCGFGPSGLSWSPDGSLLAFAYGGCDSVVHVVDADGNTRRIGDGRGPAWSPDGRLLAFAPNVPYAPCGHACMPEPPFPGAWDLQIAEVETGTVEPLTVNGASFGAGAPTFSPDGTAIAFSGPIPDADAEPELFAAVWVISVDTRESGVVEVGAWPAGWLPNGRLLIVHERTGEMSIVDLVAGEPAPIAPGHQIASVAPDGSMLAETVNDPVTGAGGTRVLSATGEAMAEIAGYPAAWAPDGRALVVWDADASTLVVVGVDGAPIAEYPVAGSPSASGAAWRPGS